MLTPEIQQKLNQLWDKFWSHGISTPVTVLEQISYLLYLRMQENETTPPDFISEASPGPYAWSYVSTITDPKERLQYVATEVFPWLQTLDPVTHPFSNHIRSATFLIPNGLLLKEAMNLIDSLDVEIKREASSSMQRQDMWGSAFEYLLNQTVPGSNGLGYTPPHIVTFICALAKPKVTDNICDPACGNGELLAGAYRQLLCDHTSEKNITRDENGLRQGIEGDLLLNKADWYKIKQDMFLGFDTDISRVRLAMMNLLVRGIGRPSMKDSNILTTTEQSIDNYSLILCNLPTGVLEDKLKLGNGRIKSTKIELLFADRIMSMLSAGGKAFLIVPGNFLSSMDKDYVAARQSLFSDGGVRAVINIPSGIFLPATAEGHAILYIEKAVANAKAVPPVWFCRLISDGYSTDGRREKLDINPLPEVLSRFLKEVSLQNPPEDNRDQPYFFVGLEEISRNSFSLDMDRYRGSGTEQDDKTVEQQVRQLWKQLAKGLITAQKYGESMHSLKDHPAVKKILPSAANPEQTETSDLPSSRFSVLAQALQQDGADTISFEGKDYSLLTVLSTYPVNHPYSLDNLQGALQKFAVAKTTPDEEIIEEVLQRMIRQFILKQYDKMPFTFRQLQADIRMNNMDFAFTVLHGAVWSLLRTKPAWLQQVYFEPDMEKKYREAYHHLRNKKAENGIYLLEV